jgi:Fur family transcriptional regulator, ferric uptake regulator
MLEKIEELCIKKDIRFTESRKIIAKVIIESDDHPDVDVVLKRVNKINPKIGIATVYRTLRLFADNNIISKHDFVGEDKSRYEYESSEDEEHHDHLINIKTGEVIEFFNEEIEKMKEKIAQDLGYKLVDHRLELYAIPKKEGEDN